MIKKLIDKIIAKMWIRRSLQDQDLRTEDDVDIWLGVHPRIFGLPGGHSLELKLALLELLENEPYAEIWFPTLDEIVRVEKVITDWPRS